MSDERLDTERYVELVRARGDDADALGLVGAAASVSSELAELADRVVEHFVLAARQAGHSWTAIGERLGISKQAARQRFADVSMTLVGGDLEIMPRLEACLEQAREEAERDSSAEIDAQHLLLGLLHTGVGAVALDKLGVTHSRVRGAMARLFDSHPGTKPEHDLAFSDDARLAVDEAKRRARELGHEHVGTEHLLFMLAADPGSRSRRVLNDLGVEFADVKRELDQALCPAPGRRRRRRRRATEPRCSFCGRTKPDVRMVSGPGVMICERCVGLAREQLARHERS